jgi:phosphohistidine phosphatase
MKKNIYLIRHAEAVSATSTVNDFDRPLTATGKKDAHRMGQRLHENKVAPDFILASPALRTISTARIIAEELNFAVDQIITDPQIYNGGIEEFIEHIKQLDQTLNTVFCVGHNPTLSWLCHSLCEEAKVSLPPCGIVGMQFQMQSWQQLTKVNGELILSIHPEHATS